MVQVLNGRIINHRNNMALHILVCHHSSTLSSPLCNMAPHNLLHCLRKTTIPITLPKHTSSHHNHSMVHNNLLSNFKPLSHLTMVTVCPQISHHMVDLHSSGQVLLNMVVQPSIPIVVEVALVLAEAVMSKLL